MRRAADILSKLLDENSRGKAQSYSSVFGGWRDLAGLSLADHSRVYEIRHNNLFVEVDHNGWVQILLLRKPRVLAKLRARYPELEIRDLKVRINPSMSRPGPEAGKVGSAAPIEGARAAPPAAAAMEGGSGSSDGGAAAESGRSPGVSRGAPSLGGSAGGDDEVDRVVSGVSQESLKRQLKKLFLSSLKNKRERP